MKQLRLQTVEEASRIEAQATTVNKFAPAYSYGWSEHLTRRNSQWDEIEPELRARWASVATNPGMSWDEARDAVRDGWDHVSPSKH